MKPPPLSPPNVARAPQREREQLRRMAHELEAVFIGQLFQAMRASVPRSDGEGSSTGQEMFTSMLDDRLASEVSRRLEHGIGEAMFRQLVRRIPGEQGPAGAPISHDAGPDGRARRTQVP